MEVLEHLQAKPQSDRRKIAPVQQRECLRDKKFKALIRQPAMHQKDHPTPLFFLDLIFLAIGDELSDSEGRAHRA
jgi:hypothetical protein